MCRNGGVSNNFSVYDVRVRFYRGLKIGRNHGYDHNLALLSQPLHGSLTIQGSQKMMVPYLPPLIHVWETRITSLELSVIFRFGQNSNFAFEC